MKLTNLLCKAAEARSKDYRLADGGGLFLLIKPNGRKYWRFRYRNAQGKEKQLSIGVYPGISLAMAREAHIEARLQLKKGIDPSNAKKRQKNTVASSSEVIDSFEEIAREWYDFKLPTWTPGYAALVMARLEQNLFAEIGHLAIKEISAKILLQAIRKIEARGANNVANKTNGYASNVFLYALASDRGERNPAAEIKGILQPANSGKNHPHLKPEEFPELVKAIAAYDGRRITKLAMEFLMLTFVRTGEMRWSKWSEFDLDRGLWTVPGERMKVKVNSQPIDHLVPLSRQAVGVINEINAITGTYNFVFPDYNKPHQPISENAILYAIKKMGFKSRHTGHGFRHTASTVLNECGLFRASAIERQLAHVDKDKIRGTYNKAQYFDERAKMMQWWADYIDQAKLTG